MIKRADTVRYYRRVPVGLRAFTLLEILLVVSLLAMLGALAMPSLYGQIKAAELPQSAERVRSMLFMARSEAIMEHCRFRIRFQPDQQQPLIEWEPDPIQFPGTFESVSNPWAQEPVLLADVQVHEVLLDRPAWTLPLSTTSDPETLKKEEEERLAESEDIKLEKQLFLRGVRMSEDSETDERRPTIVFNVDGSTEWATFIVSPLPRDQELDDEADQVWVVLDGRTGLAFVREKVTQEQLADTEFYVQREKLELPDDVDVEDLTLEVADPTGGEQAAAGEEQFTGGDMNGGLNGDLAGGLPGNLQPQSSGNDTGEQDQAGEAPTNGQPTQSGNRRAPTGNRTGDRNRGQQGNRAEGDTGNRRNNRNGNGLIDRRGNDNSNRRGDRNGNGLIDRRGNDHGNRADNPPNRRGPNRNIDDPNLTDAEKKNLKGWLDGNRK